MRARSISSQEKKPEGGLDRLIEDLRKLSFTRSEISEQESDSLSLMVDEAVKGVDIRIVYPRFYDQLLKNYSLRQQFIEAIQLLKEPVLRDLNDQFTVTKTDLAFLREAEPKTRSCECCWPLSLHRTKEQLMAVFFPPQLAFRSGMPETFESSYTLLRSEFAVDDTHYSLIVNGKLHESRDDALALSIDLAAAEGPFHPIHASLNWGEYSCQTTLSTEGVTRLTDLPLMAIFDPTLKEVQSGLNLTLSSPD